MKKLIIVPILILAIFTVTAKDLGDYDYVITKDSRYFCQQIVFGLLRIKCVLQNGEVVAVKISDIVAYKKDGHIFEKFPVFENNKPTGKTSFMELIAYKNGLKLYKFSWTEPGEGLWAPPTHNNYYVFKDKRYMLQVCPKTCEQVFSFFDIKVS